MGISAAAYAAWAAVAVSAASAIHQGQVKSNYRDYQKEQAQADAQAKSEAAQVEAERIRKQAEAQKSQAIAALAGSGVNVDSGTALRINQKIDKSANEDAYLTIVGGNNQAARLNAAAVGYGQQAGRDRTAGYVNAGTSLLGAASNNAGRGWKTA